MKTRIIYASTGIAIGLSIGLWIGTPKESEEARMIRLKAEVEAFHEMFVGDHWQVDRVDWTRYRKDKVEIAIIENRMQLERTNSNVKP